MNQGRSMMRGVNLLVFAALALPVSEAVGQSVNAAPRSRRPGQSSDSPNRPTDADAAAINFVDSLFGSAVPADPAPKIASRALGVTPAQAARRPKWSARLARNPRADDGNPPYALIDRYGGVQRYVEPSPEVNLEKHVGQMVTVRRDTGGTLLATQLELPRVATGTAARPAAAAAGGGVRLAAQEEMLPTPLEPTPADDAPMPYADEPSFESGPMIYEPYGGYSGDSLYLDGASEFGPCTSCGDAVCGGRGCGGCGFGSRPVFYARGEYLLWWFNGMDVPALVISSNDDVFNFSDPIIFGNTDDVLDSARSGARVTLGYWLDDYGRLGIQGDWLGFGAESLTFVAGSFDSPPPPFIGRPFFDMFPFDDDGDPTTPNVPGPSVQEVDTNNVEGTVTVRARSEFQAAGVSIRRNLCCISPGCTDCGSSVSCGSAVGGCDSLGGASPACPMCPLLGTACGRFIHGATRHVDMLYGVRWAQLNERLSIDEDLRTLVDVGDSPAGTRFAINDSFATSNEFIGGEIGFIADWERRRWSLELLSKLAIGSTRQRARIYGGTTIRQPGQAADVFPDSGLLVQRSNAGTYERDQFSVLPQIGVTAGYLMTDRLRLTVGYSLLYWSRVVRPGDVISLDVDTRQLPPPDPTLDLNVVRPQFVFRDSDIWAHGLNVGLDYRW